MLLALGVAAGGAHTARSQPPPPPWCGTAPIPAFAGLHRISVGDAWFAVYRVRPGVFALFEPHQSEQVISYLIVGSRRALLFDTGLGIGDIAATVRGLTALPVTVVNSHTHNDHVGGNADFSDVRDLDTAFARADARGSRRDAQAELASGEVCRAALPRGFDPAAYATRPWRVARFLKDGDRLALGGRSLQVLATPGHTPDSIALWDQAQGLVFTGDTLYPGEIYLYRPETDLEAYATSLRRLIALPGLNTVLPAHNAPLVPPALLDTVLQAFLRVRAGKVKGQRRGQVMIYTFDGFSFRLAPPRPQSPPPLQPSLLP